MKCSFNTGTIFITKFTYSFCNIINILPRNYFKILKSLKDDFGARSLIRKKDIVTLKTGFGTIFDIDTKEELAKTKVNY